MESGRLIVARIPCREKNYRFYDNTVSIINDNHILFNSIVRYDGKMDISFVVNPDFFFSCLNFRFRNINEDFNQLTNECLKFNFNWFTKTIPHNYFFVINQFPLKIMDF